ncbi:MAG: D-alanyl-D-alanine carboxypeptidase family protein [Lachnospiraceae bacterium]|nr:D-alanyl-D-alanine carboxypeptidase family protein [Lachnospiraceae bacterium]
MKTLTLLVISTLLVHGFPDFRLSMVNPQDLSNALYQQTKTTSARAVLSHPVFSDSFFAPDKLLSPTPKPTPVPTATPTPTPTPRPTAVPTRVPLGKTQAEGAGELTFTYPEPAELNTNTSTYTLLVNKEYTLSSSYIPYMVEPNVEIYHQGINERRYLQPAAATALEELFAAAQDDGYYLVLRCGFRSYKLQKQIYSSYLKNYGYYEVSRYHALPGTSEHQTGLAVDLCCEATGYENNFSILNTPEYAWLLKNCYKYGWILRYPENKTDITGYGFEPWHFRYVGVELATYLTELGITLEEYYGALPATNLHAIPEEYWSLLSEKEFELMMKELEEYEKKQEELAKQPTPTPLPDITPEPDVTPVPGITPEPDVTPIPDITPEPDVTPIPDDTASTPTPTPNGAQDIPPSGLPEPAVPPEVFPPLPEQDIEGAPLYVSHY